MLTIVGRRWFEKTNGNTYHSVAVYDGKKLVGSVDFAYGYGDMFLQTAFDIARGAGYYGGEQYSSGGYKEYGKFCQENFYTVADVARKKDL